MRKILFFIALIPSLAIARDSVRVVSVGVSYAQGLLAHLPSTSTFMPDDEYIQFIQGGLSVRIPIGKKAEIETGFMQTQLKCRTDMTFHFWSKGSGTSSFIDGIANYEMNFLTVPVSFNYSFGTGKLSPFVSAGIAYERFANGSVVSKGISSYARGYGYARFDQKHGGSATLGGGVDYNLKMVTFRLEAKGGYFRFAPKATEISTPFACLRLGAYVNLE